MRHDLYLHVRAFGQGRNLHRGTRREIAGEILGVNFVHPGEVGEVGQEHGGLHHVGEREFLVVEDGLHVFEHALGLGFDVAGDEAAVSRIERDLARAEQQIADAHGMVVRADGGGRFRGFDDLFGGHKSSGLIQPEATGHNKSKHLSTLLHPRSVCGTCGSSDDVLVFQPTLQLRSDAVGNTLWVKYLVELPD